MCSATEKAVQSSDIALMNAQTAASKAYTADAALAFGEQQSVLNRVNAQMSYMAANPMGYTPAELHTATTAINENTATAAKQAIGSAAAFAATHGGADIGGGATGELAGQIGSAAAQSKAQQLSTLSASNEQMKRENYWKAISSLSGAGSELGGTFGTSIGGETGAANSAVGAGGGAVSADLASTEKTAGVLGAIGGLVGAGTGFVQANPGGIFGK